MPDQTNMPQGSKEQTGRPNVHKVPRQSQLSKLIQAPLNKMTRHERAQLGDLTWRDTARPNKRFHKGENRKWAMQTCTRDLGSDNLEKLIRVPSNEMT